MAPACAAKHIVEAARAVALSAHCAAGLAAAARLRTAARLLRSAEALARSAVAALTCPLPPPADAAGPAGPPAAPSARARRRRTKKEKGNMDVDPMAVKMQSVAVAGGDPVTAALPAAPPSRFSAGAAVFVPGAMRTLRAQLSRERSPRRPSPPPSASSASPSSATSPTTTVGAGGFTVGQTAVLDGLVSRPELSGCHVMLRAFDAAASRWAVALDATAEVIRVKTFNLKPLVYGPCAADG